MYFSKHNPSLAARPIPVRRASRFMKIDQPVDVQMEAASQHQDDRNSSSADNASFSNDSPEVTQNAANSPTTHHNVDWKTKALHLQAEMDNFRKRQTRRTEEAIANQRKSMLAVFLPLLDNLGRALAHQEQNNGDALRRGVELTYRELLRTLNNEDVTPIDTVGCQFDPLWHEAISIIQTDIESGIIVQEIEAGYKLGHKLLRPAKVIVAA